MVCQRQSGVLKEKEVLKVGHITAPPNYESSKSLSHLLCRKKHT